METTLRKALYFPIQWFGEAVLDKIDLRAKVQEFWEHHKEYGLRFAIPAGLWTLFEDYIAPGLALLTGRKALAAFLFLVHFEPIVYPTILWVLLTYDRALGRKPWEPDRSAMSTYTRTNIKVLSHQLMMGSVLYGMFIHFGWSTSIFAIYMLLMSMIDYVHERVWHEINWGITLEDQVEFKRTMTKVVTHTLVVSLILSSLLRGLSPAVFQPISFGCCLGALAGAYFVLESVWAKIAWGVEPTRPTLVHTSISTLPSDSK